MKKSILMICMLLGVVVLNAQSVGSGLRCFMSNLDSPKSEKALFPERFSLQTIDGKEYISLVARLAEGVSNEDIEKMGCKVRSRSGNIVSLRAEIGTLDKLVKSDKIKDIDTARKIGVPELKDAVKDVNADYVHQGLDIPYGLNGEGVIIGVADWGFDYTHPVFYDTLMQNYRIIGAWDQFRTAGNPPQGFDYGVELTSMEDLLAAECDTNNIYDKGYHGTHVASIAAGAGAGTDYRGVAFGAELIFGTWLVDEANVMDTYVWMKNFAKERNKRLVINNSWGVYSFGYMDGTSMLDEFIANMANEDSVMFVGSAGNNGDARFHIKATFDEQDTVRSEFRFDLPQSSSVHYWGETVSLAGDSLSTFSAKIEIYNSGWNLLYESEFLTADGSVIPQTVVALSETDSLIYRASTRLGTNDRPLMDWEVRFTNYNTTCHAVLVITAQNGIVHAWNIASLTTGVGNWGLPFEWRAADYIAGDSEYSISEPGLGQGMLTVAAHKASKRNSSAPSNIASFSSRGPSLFEWMKPDISAPGQLVVSAISSFATEPPTPKTTVEFNGKEYPFATLSGTSMSSPMVTGISALILQANPNLTPAQVKEVIITTAREDSYTEAVPNYVWGYGKIDAHQAVKKAVQMVGLDELQIENNVVLFPNPVKNTLFIDANQQDYELISLTDMSGRVIMDLQGKKDRLNLSNLNSGVYLLQMKLDSKILSFRVIKQ
ncbi:MAG: S8 family peptidase [Bacteroidales bacterium]|nr:S8 family peptidase [Bacteroidales bacterium]